LKIGLLADTHGYLDPALYKYFDVCDEIWHAGDIGNAELADKLAGFKPLRAVYGNIDGGDLRKMYSEDLNFTCEGAKVFMSHIGGKPPNYNKRIRPIIATIKPDIFICGHSHILRVIYDKENELLYLNPGALGRQGFHKVKTALRFDIQEGKARNMEVIEFGTRV
jgi:putative phosphoesterase